MAIKFIIKSAGASAPTTHKMDAPKTCVGIDASTKITGLVCLRGSLQEPPRLIAHERVKPKTTLAMIQKQDFMWENTMAFIDSHKPDMICIENYGLNLKNKTALIPLVTLGGVMRYLIRRAHYGYIEPSPSELKIFATGSGRAEKPDMIAAAKALGYEAQDDNMADAYFLALCGLAYQHSLKGVALKQREVIGQLELK